MKIFRGSDYILLFYISAAVGVLQFRIRSESPIIWNVIKILMLFVYLYMFIRMFYKYKNFIRVTDSEIIKAGLIRDKSIMINDLKEIKVLEKRVILISKIGKDLDIYFSGINKYNQEQIISYLKSKIE